VSKSLGTPVSRIGYKITEAGEIPQEWQSISIAEICKVIGGSTPSTDTPEYWNGNIPWATPTDVTALKSNYIGKTAQYITREGLKNSGTNLLPIGSVLITSRASIGYCAINTVPMATNQGFASLVCGLWAFNEFMLYLMLAHKSILERLADGSTFGEVSKKSIRNLKIALPTLSEQRKIAAILSTVDDNIQKTQQIIEKTEELKRGLMQQLLTHGIGHTKFKQTEIGEIPEEWEIKSVAELCHKPQYGYTASAVAEPIGARFLRITDIQNGEVDWTGVPYCGCPEEQVINYKLQPGDILFARTGATTGKSYLIKDCPIAIFGSYLIRVKTKANVDPRFLFIFFNSFSYWKQVSQALSGSAQGGVNASLLSTLKVPTPQLDEQNKIADVIAGLDSRIRTEKLRQTALGQLKKGLMQVLLTGKVRVKDV